MTMMVTMDCGNRRFLIQYDTRGELQAQERQREEVEGIWETLQTHSLVCCQNDFEQSVLVAPSPGPYSGTL